MSVLTAQGAGVRHRRRWLFRDLDLSVEPGELVAVVGPPGSGRTTLLLALADRFRLSAGKVTVTGTAVLGYVADVEAPEPVFTVAEHIRERLALLGRHRSEAAGVPLHGLDPAVQGRDLTPYQKHVLGLILAGLSRPDLVALDGLDAGLDTAEQADLWRLLADLTAAGTAVLITAREVDPARVSTVIRLGSPQHPITDVSPHGPTEPAGPPDEAEVHKLEGEAGPGDEARLREPAAKPNDEAQAHQLATKAELGDDARVHELGADTERGAEAQAPQPTVEAEPSDDAQAHQPGAETQPGGEAHAPQPRAETQPGDEARGHELGAEAEPGDEAESARQAGRTESPAGAVKTAHRVGAQRSSTEDGGPAARPGGSGAAHDVPGEELAAVPDVRNGEK